MELLLPMSELWKRTQNDLGGLRANCQLSFKLHNILVVFSSGLQGTKNIWQVQINEDHGDKSKRLGIPIWMRLFSGGRTKLKFQKKREKKSEMCTYEKYFYRIIRTSEAVIYRQEKEGIFTLCITAHYNKKSSINPIKTWADTLNIFPKKTSK